MAPRSLTSLDLDQTIKDRVQRLAQDRSRTLHGLMREAIEQYVDREERRDRFRHDAKNAFEHYDKTGLHLTGEEADVWLAFPDFVAS